MPRLHLRPRWGLAVAAGLVLAACSDSTAPPQAHLSDPVGLSSDLQAISGVLQTPMFQSFSLLSDTSTGSPVAAPSRAGALLRAAPIVPPRSLAAQAAARASQLGALRDLATTFGRGINASVVPPALLGKTFTWDVTTHAYVENASYTPAAGPDRVRIILYALDATGVIIESPLTPTGYADLIDESTASPAVDKLHVIVTGGSPTAPGTVYVDYTVSAQVTGNPVTAFTASASGFVTDGTRMLTLTATYAATQVNTSTPSAQIDVSWSVNDPLIQVELHESATFPDADHLRLTITEFSVTRGPETVSMHGTITVTLSTGSVAIDITIDVTGVPWVRVRGTDNGITVRHNDGTQLSSDEAEAFLDVFGLSASFESAVLNLFGPPSSLMGA